MRILLDENLDRSFTDSLGSDLAVHVSDLGWQGIVNGELFQRTAAGGFDLLITADKNLQYQQRMAGRPFSLMVLNVHPNTIENLVACLPDITERLSNLVPGEVYVVAGPGATSKGA